MAPVKPIILVVEDEPILRMDATDMLCDAGFDVVEAADATEAVSILESRPDIRVVFTEIDMPRGMDGMRLAAIYPRPLAADRDHHLRGCRAVR